MNLKPIKCWLLEDDFVDLDLLRSTDQKPYLLVKKSILKNGFRAFMFTEQEINGEEWYRGFLLGNIVRFFIEGSGAYRLVNIDLSENELYFERENIPIGWEPWIFYSWQSDYADSDQEIQQVLEDIIQNINGNTNPRRPLVLLRSSHEYAGAVNLVADLKKNLSRSLLSIFDLTNVAEVIGKEKSFANINVVYELSYAQARKQANQIIPIKKIRTDIVDDDTAFDFAQIKRIEYEAQDDLHETLEGTIVAILKQRNFIS